MKNSLYLASQYLWYHKIRSLILVASITVILYIPNGLEKLITESEIRMMDRATTTPLIVGEKGSSTDLVINSLYFQDEELEPISMQQVDELNDMDFGYCVPLLTGFNARSYPIVGTTLDYIHFREMTLFDGKNMTSLGDCMLGYNTAEVLELNVGDHIISSPESFFDFAGIYPLKMKITGIFNPTNTPDDNAIFTDIKNTWIIMGIGHGHQDLADETDPTLVMDNKEGVVTATAKVFMYNEITEKNKDSFHFHGMQKDFPVSSMLFVPKDEKSLTILRGRFESGEIDTQAVVPQQVVRNLLNSIFRIKQIFDGVFVAVGFATFLIFILIMTLTIRLRKDEINTLEIIGSSRFKIVEILTMEVAIMFIASLVLAFLLYLLSGFYVNTFIEKFII
jgi:putative ABC transport system permease protein